MMIGQRLDQLYPRSARTPAEPILEVSGLEARLGARGRLSLTASLTLHRGEVLGIAGLVGAGRTELLRALFGLEPIRSGQIRLGVYLGPASPARRWMQGAGLISEDRKGEGLALSLTIADNLTLSKLKGFGPLGLIFPKKQEAATNRWIDRLGIRCRSPRQRVVELSGGNQQKVALARLLHHDVDVLLLDEPTRGIDVASKALLYRLIDELAKGSPSEGHAPKAVLMVSSYLPELLGVCDRIAVMCRGRLGPARPASELSEHRLMLEATGKSP
jgi:ribose transport system ATP-binding protein